MCPGKAPEGYRPVRAQAGVQQLSEATWFSSRTFRMSRDSCGHLSWGRVCYWHAVGREARDAAKPHNAQDRVNEREQQWLRPGGLLAPAPKELSRKLPRRPSCRPARTALSSGQEMGPVWFPLAAFPLAGCLPSLPQPLSAPTQRKIPGPIYKTRALPSCLLSLS